MSPMQVSSPLRPLSEGSTNLMVQGGNKDTVEDLELWSSTPLIGLVLDEGGLFITNFTYPPRTFVRE